MDVYKEYTARRGVVVEADELTLRFTVPEAVVTGLDLVRSARGSPGEVLDPVDGPQVRLGGDGPLFELTEERAMDVGMGLLACAGGLIEELRQDHLASLPTEYDAIDTRMSECATCERERLGAVFDADDGATAWACLQCGATKNLARGG